MAGITRAQFQRLFFPGLREIIFRSYREKPAEYSKIFNMLTSTAAFEEDYTMAGVGLLQQTEEETEVPTDRFEPGLSIRYDHIDYTLQIGFSHQFIRDGKVNVWNDRSRDMGFSARQTEEVLHADLFNTGDANVGFDGVALFSASHPLIRGGGSGGQLQSNILASPSTLSVTSYRDMLTLTRLLFDETGVRRIETPVRTLVVPPQLEFVALEIVKSTTRPDTTNRADNVTMNRTDVMVWDYVLRPKAWWVASEKSRQKLKSYSRVKFTTRSYMDDRTETNWVQAREAFSFGYSDYKGLWGTYPT
jgi:phage major head subunit gpT-like protein